MLAVGPGPINITVANGSERRTVEFHRGKGSIDGTHSFKGLDDKEYRWQPNSRLWGNTSEVRGWLYWGWLAEDKHLGSALH